MPILIAALPVSLSLAVPVLQTSKLTLDLQTATVTVRLKRQTTLEPLIWPNPLARLKVTIVAELAGERYIASTVWSGGILLDRLGIERTHSVLTYQLPWGFFGARSGNAKRLGESRAGTYQVSVELERIAGDILSELELSTDVRAAPPVPFRSSVAFDAVSSAQGTNIAQLSFSHTAAGSDRAVFVGIAAADGVPAETTSVTYGGTACTEDWDVSVLPVGNAFYANSGHHLVAPATGAQTVVATKVQAHDELTVGAISMTGVDQTTPIGAVPTPTNANASQTATITVADVGADDLVISNLICGWNGSTPGADQTERWEQVVGGTTTGSGDTQPGTAGGVMSATRTAAGFADAWIIGAVAFKPGAELKVPYPLTQQPYPYRTQIIGY